MVDAIAFIALNEEMGIQRCRVPGLRSHRLPVKELEFEPRHSGWGSLAMNYPTTLTTGKIRDD